MNNELRINIKAFKATNNIELCELFIKGHREVLESYNVPKITSDNNEWKYNEDVYVLIVESSDKKIVGGARIHIKNKKYELPIESAFNKKHKDFKLWFQQFKNQRIGEMCGLWNSKSIAGSGVSLLLTRSIMAKSGIIVANQLQLNTLFSLCAPWTVSLVEEFGFSIAKEIGKNGTYPYPKPDLPATIMYLDDTDNLSKASKERRSNVMKLREKPIQKQTEERKGIKMQVYYDLIIQDI